MTPTFRRILKSVEVFDFTVRLHPECVLFKLELVQPFELALLVDAFANLKSVIISVR